MAISSSEPKKRTINKTTEQMNTTIWVIIWVTIVLGSMITYLIWDFDRKDRHRAARNMIDELKAREGNLLQHISFICPEKDRSYLRQIASVLTLGELIDGLRGFPRRRDEEIKIFLEPHLMRCNSFEDLARLEDELESINFQIRHFRLTAKSAKQWLRFSQSYSVACSRFGELEYPKWGRPIIEQFGSEALEGASTLLDLVDIRNSFQIRYQTWDKKPRYCPIYYFASELLLTEIQSQTENAKTLRCLAVILAQIVEYDVGEDAYKIAMTRANKMANKLPLDEVIATFQRRGLNPSEVVEAEKIIEQRLLDEKNPEAISDVIPLLIGRLKETATELIDAGLF